jgi:hypothetical protein
MVAMKVGDIHSGAVKLDQAMRMLMLRWETMKDLWRDAASKNFEDSYLADLEPQVKVIVEAAGRLTEVLDRAQQEVG